MIWWIKQGHTQNLCISPMAFPLFDKFLVETRYNPNLITLTSLCIIWTHTFRNNSASSVPILSSWNYWIMLHVAKEINLKVLNFHTGQNIDSTLSLIFLFSGLKWMKDLITTWLNCMTTGHLTTPPWSPSYPGTTSPMLDFTCISRPQQPSSSCRTCWSSWCAWWGMEWCVSSCWGAKTCGLSPICSS